jgi:xylulokinase
VPLVAGVASSIAATRVEVRDADDGRVVSSARVAHPRAVPPRSEQAPAAWWRALSQALDAVGAREIVALSVAAQPAGLVCVDRAGTVLRPAKLWNDTEAAVEADALVRATGPGRWAGATGSVPTATSTVSKMAWLARRHPHVLAATAQILTPHDYLTLRLTGRALTDRANASVTGYWSPFDERWRPDVLAGLVSGTTADEWRTRLPEIVGPAEPADWMSASVNEHLGLRGRPLVASGTTELAAAALAVTALVAGDGVLAWVDEATSVASVTDEPTADDTGAVIGGADATGRFLPHVQSHNGVVVVHELAGLLGADAAGLSRAAMAAPRGADGVVVVPHLDGERWPDRDPGSGALTGLRRGVRREAVARAVFDAVGGLVAQGIDALVAAGVVVTPGSPVVLAGEGRSWPAMRQAIADASGHPIHVAGVVDAVAAGAAIQAAAVHHEVDPVAVARAWAPGVDDVVEPSRRERRRETHESP